MGNLILKDILCSVLTNKAYRIKGCYLTRRQPKHTSLQKNRELNNCSRPSSDMFCSPSAKEKKVLLKV